MSSATTIDPALGLACALARRFEGCSLKPYRDPGGVWTIGYGEVYLPSGDTVCSATPPITRAQAEAMLAERMAECVREVDGVVTVPLSPHQTAALADFVFNLGYGAFRGSTLLKLLNASDYEDAADQFLVWDKERINGELVVEPGLVRRREAERTLFLTGGTGNG